MMTDSSDSALSPIFFATPADFRAWLEVNHSKLQEQWIGFHKKSTNVPSITWPEAVDQALCFGWIDGVRRSIDSDRYMIRFTPRKARSTWSAVNIRRVQELTAQGLMCPAGLAAFTKLADENSAIYSYEQRQTAALSTEDEQKFRANESAWDFFQTQPPWYQRSAIWWVISAKRQETQQKRLATLIADSAQHKQIALLTRKPRVD